MTSPIYRFPSQAEIASHMRRASTTPWSADPQIIQIISTTFSNQEVNESGITATLAIQLENRLKEIDSNMKPEQFVCIQRALKQSLIKAKL